MNPKIQIIIIDNNFFYQIQHINYLKESEEEQKFFLSQPNPLDQIWLVLTRICFDPLSNPYIFQPVI